MPERDIVLVHLSDIHFIKGMTGGAYDLDEPVRNELKVDVARSVRGRADAILISGDVAYGGERTEYEIAQSWLEEVRRSSGCPESRVWAVPGNHDIHLPAISPILQTIHGSFRTMAEEGIDEEIAKYMRHQEDGQHLFRPLANYNQFAHTLGCDIGPEKPFWKQEIPFADGSVLRVLGFNSVLISSLNDRPGNMILGREQVASMVRQPEIVYLTMCHHPVDWCRNKDALERPLRILPRVLLFGHKHNQEVYSVENGVRITAGAVHPYRRARDWLPRYNVICMSIFLENDRRRLKVEVCPHIWSEQTQRFEIEMNDGQPCKGYTLALDPWERPEGPVPAAPDPLEVFRITSETDTVEGLTAMRGDVLLASRFLGLPFHRRMAVAVRLALLEQGEHSLPEDEVFRRVFRRARDQRLLRRLWDAIQNELAVKDDVPNPFC